MPGSVFCNGYRFTKAIRVVLWRHFILQNGEMFPVYGVAITEFSVKANHRFPRLIEALAFERSLEAMGGFYTGEGPSSGFMLNFKKSLFGSMSLQRHED